MTVLGVIYPPMRAPEQLLDIARDADAAGLEQLWVWEDCFKESGIATAAAALGATERLTLGIGLLPVPLRNVAITAMEIAAVDRMFPGRARFGVGHGVLDWMGQVGARQSSPLTLLGEHLDALRALLAGDEVTTDGRYVHLDDVALDFPPDPVPPLVVGARRPKTVAVGAELGDGVILDEQVDDEALLAAVPSYVAARTAAGRHGVGQVITFRSIDDGESTQRTVERVMTLAGLGATHVMLRPKDVCENGLRGLLIVWSRASVAARAGAKAKCNIS